MQIDPQTLSPRATYKLMTGTIVPRPIGWISTVSTDGINNVAPFSFFNAISSNPPHVVFSSGRPNGTPKDSARNALATGEFVVNLVTESTAEAMNITATVLPSDVDEFVLANLTPSPSAVISAPRVLESPVNYECQVVHHYEMDAPGGGTVLIVGKIVMIHVADSIVDDEYNIDIAAYQPVGRLMGGMYCRVNDLFRIDRFSAEQLTGVTNDNK